MSTIEVSRNTMSLQEIWSTINRRYENINSTSVRNIMKWIRRETSWDIHTQLVVLNELYGVHENILSSLTTATIKQFSITQMEVVEAYIDVVEDELDSIIRSRNERRRNERVGDLYPTLERHNAVYSLENEFELERLGYTGIDSGIFQTSRSSALPSPPSPIARQGGYTDGYMTPPEIATPTQAPPIIRDSISGERLRQMISPIELFPPSNQVASTTSDNVTAHQMDLETDDDNDDYSMGIDSP